MKKIVPIFMLAFLGLFPIYANAACNTPVTLSFEGNQDPDDDEFLYDNKKQFDLTKQGYINSGKKNSGDGRGYECDQYNSGGCSRDNIITLNAGHYFKGKLVNKKTRYQCMAGYGVNDHWKVVDDGTCHTNEWGDIAVGKRVSKNLTEVECSGYTLTDPNGVEFEGICRKGPKFVCKAIKCREGMVAKDGKCIIGQAKTSTGSCPKEYQDGYVPCYDWQTKMGATQCYRKCHSDNKGATTLIVKCDSKTTPADRNKGWTTAKGEALYEKCVGDTSAGIAPTPSPSNPGKKPGKTNPSNPQQPGAPAYTCPSGQLQWMANLKISCANKTEVQSQIAMIENYCNGTGVSETAFNEYIAKLMELSQKLCGASAPNEEEQLCNQISDAHIVNGKCTCDDSSKILDRDEMVCKEDTGRIISESRERIATIASKINSLKSGLGTSVWKDKEGNFNTSRLVSDSVAGVVLGTAGGLITSSIVKKNQVKSGFGDISCTVRGQVVSGYGDEFQVGIQ